MLTLEQIEEGRELLRGRACDVDGDLANWLTWNAKALLDAAERVARQEAYNSEPDGYDSPEVEAVREAGRGMVAKGRP